jgi:Ni/Co efflux regulator RcnB
MKHALFIAAALALSGLAGPAAWAQGWDQDHDHRPAWQDHHGPGWRRHEELREERHWRVGDRLPPAYYARPYVIVKPVAYHLHRPPRGHQWIRVGRSAALIVSGTGVVVEWVPGIFH